MQKNPYTIAIVAIVLVLVVGVIAYIQMNPDGAGMPNQAQKKTSPTAANTSTRPESPTVTYTDQGYAANFLSVKAGTTVVWKNQSSQKMWTASAMHPAHKEYPLRGGCIASVFDQCRGDLPGTTWQFAFGLTGTWRYHNHLNPSHFGTIIVE